MIGVCKCGHTPGCHAHYRRGTDCGVCRVAGIQCDRFRFSLTQTLRGRQ